MLHQIRHQGWNVKMLYHCHSSCSSERNQPTFIKQSFSVQTIEMQRMKIFRYTRVFNISIVVECKISYVSLLPILLVYKTLLINSKYLTRNPLKFQVCQIGKDKI